jgi:hypothetical protein
MQTITQQLVGGDINWVTAAVACAEALLAGALGGAVGGVLVGGKHIGYGMAALMGTFFGPLAALPGVMLALVVLLLW